MEVLIAVAIIGILAAIAYPSFSEQMKKNRRSEAIAFLAHAAAEQERYFSDNTRYATTLTQLGFGDSTTTEEGYYSISVTNVAGSNAASEVHFQLKATPVAGGPQASDETCGTLSINERGVKGKTGSGSVQDCW